MASETTREWTALDELLDRSHEFEVACSEGTHEAKALGVAYCAAREVVEAEQSRLRAALAEAEREAGIAQRELAIVDAQRDGEHAAVERLTVELARKDAALRRYGQHKIDCPNLYLEGGRCDCGYAAALASPTASES